MQTNPEATEMKKKLVRIYKMLMNDFSSKYSKLLQFYPKFQLMRQIGDLLCHIFPLIDCSKDTIRALTA